MEKSAGESKRLRFRKPRSFLNGSRFGRLVVQSWAGNSSWICLCDCGRKSIVLTANLKRGNTTSCGCVKRIKSSKRATTHGLSKTLAYKSWTSMVARCHRPSGRAYAQYGAKGIKVCDEWRRDPAAFIAHVGQPPTPEHTLDRIDNSKGYEPGNVRWATAIEQARNKTNNVSVEFDGLKFSSLTAFADWLRTKIKLSKSQANQVVELISK